MSNEDERRMTRNVDVDVDVNVNGTGTRYVQMRVRACGNDNKEGSGRR